MPTLDQRSEILLRTLIERYITDGAPVGSRTLAKHSGLEVSPATIRNVMADLEDMGLIISPHTSAGRVPTQMGYRVFVDSLIQVQPLNQGTIMKLEGELVEVQNRPQAIEAASGLLSELTQLAAVVSVPGSTPGSGFRQIEFVGLNNNRVLVILVTGDGEVQNRIIHTERTYSTAELVQAANHFNEVYTGQSLGGVKEKLLREIEQDSERMQQTMRTAVEMAQKLFAAGDDDKETLVVRGESNLMDIPDLGDMHTLRKLFDAFGAKRDLLHLLDESMRGPGVKIFIGNESGYEALEECSVVVAPYKIDEETIGMLGVVGPTRMSYERVIPIVDITAKLLGNALTLSD